MKEFRQATVIRYEDVLPLVEALKFYANKENWNPPVFDIFAPSLVRADNGNTARLALSKQPQVRIATAEIER